MKRICCVLLAALPLTAMAFYPIEVEKQLNGAEVSYDTQDAGGNVAALLLRNNGERSASCKAVFANGPENPRTRKVVLEPGKSANLTSSFKQQIIKLRIKLTCEPV
ncbi:3-phosphoglycerate kinase [Pseudomonas schmalbachii]|uniref:3-phosphoglycerate kinase n=1 Tax=Pseudomonas schmalbachii TaxID=2816993 RepID=A0ABS3TU57_9PSED|nr:3-phosphoglycerate kinase [Pseudomonas schmalbachii]MBO3277194.1 3-phosphoglycerate kinase [Pseudomonas schmalbachii]